MDIHRSALRHGIEPQDIVHASDHALVVVDLEPDADPPKVLVIGPDRTGALLELVILELADERFLAIHAMPLRRRFYDLLPRGDHE